jgi:UDP-N-acetylmuramyl pentapeptide phosphotransferase/UDP-N-acetylglucosamine-1-phosphate transferase
LVPLALSIPSTQAPLIAVSCVAAAMVAATVVNFMDGLDGLIGLQELVFATHIALLAIPGKLAATVGMVIAAAALGFLVWNWHPARVFLGDVGSNALAILSLYAAILVFAEGRWELWSILLPLFPLLFDALATLLLRATKGERLSQAHRKHLYQRLANERWGHPRVAVLYGLGAALGSAVVLLSDDATRPIAASLYMISMVTLWCILHYRFRQSLEPELPVVSR